MKIFKPKFKPYNNPNVIIFKDKLASNVVNELHYAQDVIGNYAKANKAMVEFFPANYNVTHPLGPSSTLLNQGSTTNVGVKLYKGDSPQARIAFVDYAKTEKEPFLRQVYRAVENLVKDINS